MINAILVHIESGVKESLEPQINRFCPQINIKGKTNCITEALKMVFEKKSDLLFIGQNPYNHEELQSVKKYTFLDFESIFITKNKEFAIDAFELGAIGCLIHPISKEDLVSSVNRATQRIRLREEHNKNIALVDKVLKTEYQNKKIGIPTLKGFNFFFVEEILRCEALQRCTRIVTRTQSNVISSYNLGEFKRLLEPFGFFSPHKSHLINLRYVKEYQREGTIIMTDQSSIPVARRKKSKFLNVILHL